MNPTAGLLFFVVAIGLLSILRTGQWRWNVLAPYGQPILGSTFLPNLFVGIFWLGWFASLIMGLFIFFGVFSF